MQVRSVMPALLFPHREKIIGVRPVCPQVFPRFSCPQVFQVFPRGEAYHRRGAMAMAPKGALVAGAEHPHGLRAVAAIVVEVKDRVANARMEGPEGHRDRAAGLRRQE